MQMQYPLKVSLQKVDSKKRKKESSLSLDMTQLTCHCLTLTLKKIFIEKPYLKHF